MSPPAGGIGGGVVRVLGPQRVDPTVGAEVAELAPDGPVATVTAGWRDREPDDAELDGLLGGRSVNLALERRRLEVQADDPELAAAERQLEQRVAVLRSRYLLRLRHALAAVTALQELATRDPVPAEELDEAIEVVRRIDARHLERVAGLRAELDQALRPTERPAMVHHRTEVAAIVADTAAVAIAGGHVDVLLDTLRRFDVLGAAGDRPVVAWSAGAMALTDRVVLFHDRAAQGLPPAEVHDRGLGRCPGLVLLPHARARLRLDDRDRTARFARRFAPATCVVLDRGARIADARDPDHLGGVAVLDHDGAVRRADEVPAGSVTP